MTTHARKVRTVNKCFNAVNEIVPLSGFFDALRLFGSILSSVHSDLPSVWKLNFRIFFTPLFLVERKKENHE